MVQYTFDATKYEPSTGAADVFETGVYSVQIVNSEVKQTKAGTGYMLVFEMSCLDPGFQGRKITARMNIHNPSQEAVDIAHRELSSLSYSVGVLNWTETQQLHGRPFKVSVEKVERNDKPGSWSNNIKGYLDYMGNPPTSAGGQSAGVQQPTAPVQQPPAAPAPFQQAPAPAPAPAQAAVAAPGFAPAPMQAPAPAAPAPVQQPMQFAPPAAAPNPAPWQTAPQPQATPVPPWQQG